MTTRATKYSPEVRARAVRMVFEHRGKHASEWVVITSIAAKIGCKAETLRLWVRQAQRDQGLRDGMMTDERARLKALEREVRELRPLQALGQRDPEEGIGLFCPAAARRRAAPSPKVPRSGDLGGAEPKIP